MVATPSTLTASSGMRATQVQGRPVSGRSVSGNGSTMAASAQVFAKSASSHPDTDRNEIAKSWQVEAYRQVNICGEARYAATLFASIAGRAEIGVSEPQSLARKATWVKQGPEVEAFAELVPDVRARRRLTRDFMLHRTIAGECYLIARERVRTDPGYIDPPVNEATGKEWVSWDDYLRNTRPDVLSDDTPTENPNIENPLWEIVAVTELRKTGLKWTVRHENGNYLDLAPTDPVIRMWNPDPGDRMEAWSPYRSLLPTLKEIEWLTAHIFKQVRSRLMSSGHWFLPNNVVFPEPPPDRVEGGAEAIARMNEAERFMAALAVASTAELDAEDVNFPVVSMVDPLALEQIDQGKLIKFWSEIDDKAMVLRSDAVRRFALGVDMPPEQVLGSSGLAVTGAGGSAGSVNHWGVWANEEQTITMHVEPALDDFVGILTTAYLQPAVPNTEKVIGFDSASMRMRPDRSKEALELYDRGLLNGEVTVREVGFDPDNDMMSPDERREWLLQRIVSGQFQPDQMAVALALLTQGGQVIQLPSGEGEQTPKDKAGRDQPPSLDEHTTQGPPEEQHDHSPAPFGVVEAACEAITLRALEKAGSRLLNDRTRGKDKDRSTPLHLAHLTKSLDRAYCSGDFDRSSASLLLSDLSSAEVTRLTNVIGNFCANLYNNGEGYTRDALIEAVNAK